jgi:hypothetical protein
MTTGRSTFVARRRAGRAQFFGRDEALARRVACRAPVPAHIAFIASLKANKGE